MPNYLADPDIRNIQAEGRFAIPDGLDEDEVGRLRRFLEADQILEEFYRRNAPTVRPPKADLEVAAETAMAVYDQRSERLPIGWQKFAVLQAGIAGCADNLDSFRIKDWAYTRVQEHNPQWLGGSSEDIDTEMPLRWMMQLIGVDVLLGRHAKGPIAPKKRSWFGR